MSSERTRLAVMKELHELTSEMARLKDDADFLITAVDRRQELMEEYDLLQSQATAPLSDSDTAEAKRLAQEIISWDSTISSSLEGHKAQAKTAIMSNNTRQRVMGYLNPDASRSGSMMDFKK